ncbi:hypothetical protein M8J77_015704 [Diaphorina citri]|nr:hypothetical protein M8J77_015704 [Diaphorina citri]
MRWMGHVLRRDDESLIKSVWEGELTGTRRRGRPKLRWKDQIKRDMAKINTTEEDAQDRTVWRGKKSSRLQMALAVSEPREVSFWQRKDLQNFSSCMMDILMTHQLHWAIPQGRPRMRYSDMIRKDIEDRGVDWIDVENNERYRDRIWWRGFINRPAD